ncbi:Zinc finger protein [Dirofilaria immitis]
MYTRIFEIRCKIITVFPVLSCSPDKLRRRNVVKFITWGDGETKEISVEEQKQRKDYREHDSAICQNNLNQRLFFWDRFSNTFQIPRGGSRKKI